MTIVAESHPQPREEGPAGPAAGRTSPRRHGAARSSRRRAEGSASVVPAIAASAGAFRRDGAARAIAVEPQREQQTRRRSPRLCHAVRECVPAAALWQQRNLAAARNRYRRSRRISSRAKRLQLGAASAAPRACSRGARRRKRDVEDDAVGRCGEPRPRPATALASMAPSSLLSREGAAALLVQPRRLPRAQAEQLMSYRCCLRRPGWWRHGRCFVSADRRSPCSVRSSEAGFCSPSAAIRRARRTLSFLYWIIGLALPSDMLLHQGRGGVRRRRSLVRPSLRSTRRWLGRLRPVSARARRSFLWCLRPWLGRAVPHGVAALPSCSRWRYPRLRRGDCRGSWADLISASPSGSACSSSRAWALLGAGLPALLACFEGTLGPGSPTTRSTRRIRSGSTVPSAMSAFVRSASSRTATSSASGSRWCVSDRAVAGDLVGAALRGRWIAARSSWPWRSRRNRSARSLCSSFGAVVSLHLSVASRPRLLASGAAAAHRHRRCRRSVGCDPFPGLSPRTPAGGRDIVSTSSAVPDAARSRGGSPQDQKLLGAALARPVDRHRAVGLVAREGNAAVEPVSCSIVGQFGLVGPAAGPRDELVLSPAHRLDLRRRVSACALSGARLLLATMAVLTVHRRPAQLLHLLSGDRLLPEPWRRRTAIKAAPSTDARRRERECRQAVDVALHHVALDDRSDVLRRAE